MGKRKAVREFHTVVIGAGISGLAMGINLRQRGNRDFVVLEKASDIGGTWRDNTYPGCATDIHSYVYSFSFERNPNWTTTLASQPEILDYLHRITYKYGLRKHIQLDTKVTGARWDEDECRWHVSTSTDTEYVARYLVAGIGPLHLPNIPDLPGMDRFTGCSFHSARWNHDFDLSMKRVAVIGTGASAVQFVPEVAKTAERLYLFQRSPSWVMPRPDRRVPPLVRRTLATVPGAQQLARSFVYLWLDSRSIGFTGQLWLLKAAERVARQQITKAISDPRLREKVTPDYTLGCKRVQVADDYYPALARPNVEVVTDGIAEVCEHSLVDAAGVEREVDAIIFGTGFHVTDTFEYLPIIGKGGNELAKQWRSTGVQTYLGMTAAGYPNFFMLLGPNTGLSFNSVISMIEAQARYVAEAMTLVERNGADTIEVLRTAQDQFQAELERRLDRSVWHRGGCTSYYLDAEGVNRTLWPGSSLGYRVRTRTVDLSSFRLTKGHRRVDHPDQTR